MGYGGSFDPMGGFGGFDGGGAGAGGFMAGGDGDAAGDKSSDKKRVGDKASLIPLSVKQVLQAAAEESDSSIHLEGAEIHTVKLMGSLHATQVSSTNVVFMLSDGHHSIECKQYIDRESGSEQIKVASMKEGAMIRVIGSPRDYDGKRHLLVFECSEVEDFNELTHHMLDVVYNHLQRTGAINHPAIKAGGNAAQQNTPAGKAGSFSNQQHFQGVGGMPAGGAGLRASAGQADGSDLSNQVLQLFQKYGQNSQHGAALTDIVNYLPPGSRDMQQVMRVVQTLCNEGQLYTTIDDNHYHPTEMQ